MMIYDALNIGILIIFFIVCTTHVMPFNLCDLSSIELINSEHNYLIE